MSASRAFLSLRLFVALSLLAGLTAGAWLHADPPGSRTEEEGIKPKRKPPRVEEEEKPAGDQGKKDAKKGKRTEDEKEPAPRGKRTEDEDPGRVKRKPIRVDDEDDKTPRKADTTVPVTDLAQAARDAKHPEVKHLFRGLAVPHDVVVTKGSGSVTVGGETIQGRRLDVEPLPEYVSDPGELRANPKLHILDSSGKRIRTESPGAGRILAIRYYEQLAVAEVKGFLEQHFENLDPDNSRFLSRLDQLQVAEQVLSVVTRFHVSAREREVRQGDGWNKVEDSLRQALLGVLLEQMEGLAAVRDWDQAFALTRRILETFNRPAEANRLAKPMTDLLKKSLSDPTFSHERLVEIRQKLRELERQFPKSDVITSITQPLRDQAQSLYQQAEKVEKANPEKALALIKQAEDTWPELPGLRTARIRMDNTYKVLSVAARDLPRYLSPARACTDSELRAVDLLFESLVKLSPDPSGTLVYRTGLTEGRPRVLSLGREFRLPRNAVWSDGEKLSGSDLRRTFELLQLGKGTGRSAAWGTLVERLRVDRDPYTAEMLLKQGFLDPLAAASFKVVPQQKKGRAHPDSVPFAEKPVTSGPFLYAGRVSDPIQRREYASFVPNPAYGARPGKLGLPRLKEVRYYAVASPGQDLQNHSDTDLALDLTAEEAATLMKSPEKYVVPLPGDNTPDRRIYFLAVNNRGHKPTANADLRVALARAINREKLLNDHFRGPLPKIHKALNGPYPAGSWACNPALVSRSDKASLDPYDPDLARSKLKLALASPRLNGVPLKLKLKYPSGDKAVEEAMTALAAQVQKELPEVTLEPVACTPWGLREDVEEKGDYDLAYYHHDFADESFWLLPLLGPAGRTWSEGAKEPNGSYLGYNGPLAAKIQASTSLRNFAQVREYAHAVHRDFLEREMPFIPLWQLAPLWAYRKSGGKPVLDTPPVEPRHLFADIEEWSVQK